MSNTDKSGDSSELEALFDSIAADPAGVADGLNPSRAAAAVFPIDDSGDTDELQALFDAVAEQSGQGGMQPAAAPAAAAGNRPGITCSQGATSSTP